MTLSCLTMNGMRLPHGAVISVPGLQHGLRVFKMDVALTSTACVLCFTGAGEADLYNAFGF